MKGKRFFVLATAAALALLFAGCGQQGGTGGGGTGDGAVTSVGIAPTYNDGVLSGIAQVKITVNEGARIQRIVLKVDGQEVSRITSQGLRPQAVEYTLTFDTAAYDPNTLQPKFPNGQRTLSAEVTDVQGNTKTASIQATFQNQDRVVGLTVSQTDNPNAPVTVGNTKWYGNGNVTVSVGIVSYSGATYSLQGNGPSFNLVASGGTTGQLSGYKVVVTPPVASGSPVTGQPAVLFAKSANLTISEEVTVEVQDNNSNVVVQTSFGLDNVAPDISSATVQVRRPLLDKDFVGLSGTQQIAGSTLFRGSGANDGTAGVGGITYKVRFNVGSNNIDKDLPDAPSAGVTWASLGLTAGIPYNVGVIAASDALGNTSNQPFPSTPPTVQQEDRTLTVNANFGPGGTANTFDIININVGGNPVGSLTYYVLIPATSGKFVLVVKDDQSNSGSNDSITNIIVANGARYRLLAVDQAGNFGFVDQPSGVSYSTGSTDTTPPSVTVTLPSTPPSNSTSFTVSGTASDNVALYGNGVGIYLLQAVAGGAEYYLDGPTPTTVGSNNQYSASVTAPNYAATLGVVVGAIDTGGNPAFATGTVQVK
ncbi:hypothetical protein [Thermus oshimai]|uniref:hypothetical protein n=1 Tax=Thermus oshimai TaxID=56957 RepID=UPI00036C7817|nr:hypothetical protein [Thermus oshimai]